MILKVACKKSIINISNLFNKLTSPFFGFFQHICRNSYGFKRSYIRFISMIDESLHVNKVDYSYEVLFSTNRYLNRNRVSTKFLLNLLNNAEEISSGTIHFINKGYSRYHIFISLSPYGFRLRFNATNCTE